MPFHRLVMMALRRRQAAHSINLNRKALTLLEILISVIILALVVTGLANVFVAGKRYIQHNRSRMTGGELGKYFLDPLQTDVNASTWSTNRLGTHTASPVNVTLDRQYTGTYTITNNSPATNINKVKVNITWTE